VFQEAGLVMTDFFLGLTLMGHALTVPALSESLDLLCNGEGLHSCGLLPGIRLGPTFREPRDLSMLTS
jgi:hypothetical protein